MSTRFSVLLSIFPPSTPNLSQMGVHGLTSFIRQNRRSLSTTITLDPDGEQGNGKAPVVVVDAWGSVHLAERTTLADGGSRIIYQLYLDSLPWTSGGEYLRFYRLVRRLIIAWRKLGLEPTFVFDG